MKKLLILLLTASIAVVILVGCAFIFGTTLSMNFGSGYCYELETAEASVIIFFSALGFEEKSCDETDFDYTCAYHDSEYDQDMINYYTQDYIDNVATTDVEAECESDGGTWKEL